MPILVTGATGTVGRLVVDRLLERGQRVRAMARHPERGHWHDAVEPVAADFDDADAVRAALAGVRRVFLLTGGPDGPRHDDAFAAAAVRAGVEYVVKLSVVSLSEGADDPITRWHRRGEDAVRESGLACAFLRAGAFMSNTLAWAPAMAEYGVVETPFADLPSAAIAPEDIADVAAATLIDPVATGTAYALTGAAAITARQQADILAELLGTAVRVTELQPEQARDRMIGYGMIPDLAAAVVATLGGPAHGIGCTPSTTLESLTGRPAMTFRDWATAHLTEFRNPVAAW